MELEAKNLHSGQDWKHWSLLVPLLTEKVALQIVQEFLESLIIKEKNKLLKIRVILKQKWVKINERQAITNQQMKNKTNNKNNPSSVTEVAHELRKPVLLGWTHLP